MRLAQHDAHDVFLSTLNFRISGVLTAGKIDAFMATQSRIGDIPQPKRKATSMASEPHFRILYAISSFFLSA